MDAYKTDVPTIQYSLLLLTLLQLSLVALHQRYWRMPLSYRLLPACPITLLKASEATPCREHASGQRCPQSSSPLSCKLGIEGRDRMPCTPNKRHGWKDEYCNENQEAIKFIHVKEQY